jgi:hypothetical protein
MRGLFLALADSPDFRHHDDTANDGSAEVDD